MASVLVLDDSLRNNIDISTRTKVTDKGKRSMIRTKAIDKNISAVAKVGKVTRATRNEMLINLPTNDVLSVDCFCRRFSFFVFYVLR